MGVYHLDVVVMVGGQVHFLIATLNRMLYNRRTTVRGGSDDSQQHGR